MSKFTFTKTQINQLKNNEYVESVSSKGITYSLEFKYLAVEDYLAGMSAKEVFSKYGFDSNIIGDKRASSALARWKRQYHKDGLFGLKDAREHNQGRPTNRELTDEDKMKCYEAKIKYLEAEVELLKKLDAIERTVLKNNKQKVIIYQLIETTISQNNMKYKVKYLCDLAQVSRSGYYSYLKAKSNRDAKELKDQELLKYVQKAMKYKGYKKGSRQLTMRINRLYKAENIEKQINRKCVQRIMRKYGIVCPIRKANPYRKMAKATKEHCVVENIVNREFKPGTSGKVLLTDVTYLHYNGHKKTAYLSTIKDSQTNEILAYKVSKSLAIDFVLNTIKDLKKAKYLDKEPIIHSDYAEENTMP